MKPHLMWFAAGSVAGLYASLKAKRAAYRLSPSGMVDQASALGVGWRAFSSELQHGMTVRERQIAHDLALPVDYGPDKPDLLEPATRELQAKEQH